VQFGRIAFLTGALVVAGFCAQAPQTGGNEAAPGGSAPVIKAETRLVLVDTVVTDKNGAYVSDLTRKDFRVWEDNKEQAIKSFSVEQGAASPAGSQKRYVILFFDNSTMSAEEQTRARAAAQKFVEANAGGNLAMAVANFGGMLQIAQSFTTDPEMLKRAVSGLKESPAAPGNTVEVASLSMPSLAGAADFGARTSLLALRSLAKSLTTVPGRKTLILLTSGYKIQEEYMSEVTAAINECNKSNVAVYPIDVHGLMAGGGAAGPGPQGAIFGSPTGSFSAAMIPAGFTAAGVTVWPYVRMASLSGFAGSPSAGQKGGGGGGGGRGGGGFGGGGPAPNTGSVTSTGVIYNPYGGISAPGQATQPRTIIPQLPASTANNQQVMYMLASGTGGFVIASTNDLVNGLEKIAKEQNQYYLLSYTPAESQEGSCHTIRVKVERSGAIVRARSGYCNVPPQDQLAGDPIEKEMEVHTSAPASGGFAASISDPFFYTSANAARVNVVMDVPSNLIKPEKEKGRLHAEVNVLGIAYKADGTAAARFSDTVKLDFADKDELQRFQQKPMHYENQFDVAPGKYTLKVVINSGSNFGTVEAPLVVDPWDGRHFAMSAMAFSKEYHKVSSANTGLDTQLLEGRTPMIAKGMEIVPSGTNQVKKAETAILYVEVYEPLLLSSTHPPRVALHLKVEDRKTGAVANDMGMLGVDTSVEPGNPVVPVGLQVPIDKLAPGGYRLVLQAVDSVGRSSVVRSMDLDVLQ
jgi:VWFA-related protein